MAWCVLKPTRMRILQKICKDQWSLFGLGTGSLFIKHQQSYLYAQLSLSTRRTIRTCMVACLRAFLAVASIRESLAFQRKLQYSFPDRVERWTFLQTPQLQPSQAGQFWIHFTIGLSIGTLHCFIGFSNLSIEFYNLVRSSWQSQLTIQLPCDDFWMNLEYPHRWIASQGYTTIALLGYAVPKADALEDFVKFLTPSADGSEFQPFSPQVACLRRAVEVFRCHPERPWNWQPVSCTRGWSYYSGLASSTQSLGTTTIFGNPSENLGTATSFGRSSESGLQGWWWAECPIKTSATSDVAEILRDLCFWQSLSPSMSIAELTEKITTAGWYSLL